MQLPPIPAKLPSSQAEWTQVYTALNSWVKAIQNPPWQTPSLLNSWVSYGSGQTPAGYLQDVTGRIWLRGLVKGGANGTIAMQLPYTPSNQLVFATVVNAGGSGYEPGEIDIDTSGNVSIYWESGALTWATLNGLSYDLRP